MKKVLLLAMEHLREQRWALVVFVAYVILMALAFGAGQRPQPEEVQFFVRQQASFAVLFTLFLAAGALHAERRSRRILAVLSKSVSRRSYVRSILIAMWLAAALYTATSSVALLWIAQRAGIQARG